jgi:hypothetical protein
VAFGSFANPPGTLSPELLDIANIERSAAAVVGAMGGVAEGVLIVA